MTEAAFDYAKAKSEKITCNLCRSDRFSILAKKSSDNRKVQVCICKNCGLIYINPRMTKEWYDIYYNDFYRNDRTDARGYTDKASDPESNFKSARKFGNALGKKLKSFLNAGLTIDVGSSTGGALYGLKEIIPELEIYGIEPSEAESDYAVSKGIKTYHGLFENFAAEKSILRASNIFCVRSLNHLLSPRGFFEWAFDSLKDGGSLILYVKNFRYQARRAGSVEAGVQIDHPYMFAPETLKNFVELAGFNVMLLEDDEKKTWAEIASQKKDGLSAHHILLVAKKNATTKKNVRAMRNKINYLRTLFQLSQPFLKIYYLAAHSGRTEFLRKLI